jgi:1,2-diacylglycerol 3-alpha-glucosyltransferase
MNIGIVSFWFNRGQATVGRYLRWSFDQMGHSTAILARPAKDRFFIPGAVEKTGVWDQEGVTVASNYVIPEEEYLNWAKVNNLDVVFFDQNYQFDEIHALRLSGVKTIGRFVWESFADKDISGAKAALDKVYSVTKCEKERYAKMDIDSFPVQWGIFPELNYSIKKREKFTFFYPGGFLSTRKPTGEVIQAFREFIANSDVDADLIVKTQRPMRQRDLMTPEDWAELKQWRNNKILSQTDVDIKALEIEGIYIIEDDLDAEQYRDLFASCHVCIAPSRWEGLGLHLYESLGYGLPLICNDMAPLNEIVVDGSNGFLTKCGSAGVRENGIDIMSPDIFSMATAMIKIADPSNLNAMGTGVEQAKKRLHWSKTQEDLATLLRDVCL